MSVTCTDHDTVLQKYGLPQIWYHLFLLYVGPPLEGHRVPEAHTQAVQIAQIMFNTSRCPRTTPRLFQLLSGVPNSHIRYPFSI